MGLLPFVQGAGLGASMIIPIGAQNSYVLNQSIKRNHHYIAAIICVFFDVTLMGLGVYGGAELLNASPVVFTLITWGGILFLLGYGLLSFKAAFKPVSSQEEVTNEHKSLKVVILTTLAVTLLNPHVYLDTIVIVSSVSSQFQAQDKSAFAAGIMVASVLWFICLTKGGAKLSGFLTQTKVRQGLDFTIGTVMWLIALSLYVNSK